MKNLISILALIVFTNVFTQLIAQTTAKTMAPVWKCTKVTMQCASGLNKGNLKTVYVESTASWSVFTNEGVVIKNSAGVEKARFQPITSTSYNSPAFYIPGGQTYTVTVIDGAGNTHINNDGTPNQYTIVAPKCTFERPISSSPSTSRPVIGVLQKACDPPCPAGKTCVNGVCQ